MAMVHQSANFYCDLYIEKMRRYAYATPKNYLDFIHTFLDLYKQKKEDLSKQAERLNVGIIRIDEASILIQEMDKKLEKQRKELGKYHDQSKRYLTLSIFQQLKPKNVMIY
jgi:hypothetical protein